MDSKELKISEIVANCQSILEAAESYDITTDYTVEIGDFNPKKLYSDALYRTFEHFLTSDSINSLDNTYCKQHAFSDCSDDFKHLHWWVSKTNKSLFHFNKNYFEHCEQLESEWQNALQFGLNPQIFQALNKQQAFLRDLYQDYFNIYSITYHNLLCQLYGNAFVDYHYYCLNKFKLNFTAFTKRTQAEKKLNFKSHLLVGMPPEHRIELYQAITHKIFNQHFACSIDCHYHEKNRLFKVPKENSYVISLADNLTFSDELDQLFCFLGEIFYGLLIKDKEDPVQNICHASYAKEQMIAFFQFLPLACPSVRKFIITTALSLEGITQTEKNINFYEQELLMYYISFHSNPLRTQLVNPLQRVNLLYCEIAIEKKWFNNANKSEELPLRWEKITRQNLNKTPTHSIEGTLRMDYWKQENIGKSFIKLISIFTLFREKLTDNGEVIVFKQFSHYFDNDCIHLWDYQQLLNKQISDELNPAQNTLNFIGKFYNTYIYRRPLTKDKY